MSTSSASSISTSSTIVALALAVLVVVSAGGTGGVARTGGARPPRRTPHLSHHELLGDY